MAGPDHADAAMRILCAEDNAFGRAVLKAMLEAFGHEADFVDTGEAAVEAVAAGSYDAVLMDVNLRGMDGLAATRAVRALEGPAARTAVIGLSGRAEPEDAAAARDAGMDAYLVKPVGADHLAAALREALSGRRA